MIHQSASLNEAERFYKNGQAAWLDLVEYIRGWNAGPHLTQAVFSDGTIRNFDPESPSAPRHLFSIFGVRAGRAGRRP